MSSQKDRMLRGGGSEGTRVKGKGEGFDKTERVGKADRSPQTVPRNKRGAIDKGQRKLAGHPGDLVSFSRPLTEKRHQKSSQKPRTRNSELPSGLKRYKSLTIPKTADWIEWERPKQGAFLAGKESGMCSGKENVGGEFEGFKPHFVKGGGRSLSFPPDFDGETGRRSGASLSPRKEGK